MSTMTKSLTTSEVSHTYHAKAEVLSGHLRLPLEREIQPQAPVLLNTKRDGYFFQRAERYSLEGLVAFKSGYTHVSGNRSLKNHGWVTLATSVLEGLNVLDVITADRMVAQLSTEHPVENGHVPYVTFLGTQFENLRIGGYPVQVELDLGICGDRPNDPTPYTQDAGFLNRVQRQCESIVGTQNIPRDLQVEYDKELEYLAELRTYGDGSGKRESQPNSRAEKGTRNYNERWGEAEDNTPRVKCSLVKEVSPIPVAKSFGNVLAIPGFGIASLAAVEVSNRNYFTLTMLDMRLGCIGDGKVQAVTTSSNGHTYP